MNNNLLNQIEKITKEIDFSGTIIVKNRKSLLASTSTGYANRSELIRNKHNTRFGIASGCKIFTAIAICQLVESGELSFHTKLKHCLSSNFPHFDEDITVHHLLTHTSGVPDYFDEEVMDDYEKLWKYTPMYHMRSLNDFLPLFQDRVMKFKPGTRFHYNNAGYILLGLIVEHISGMSFTQYVETEIFTKADMQDSGYFALDSLPKNTALGYIENADKTWRTNTYSLPIQGGSDGGAFVTANDMMKFWDALLDYKLLGKELTKSLLNPYAHVGEDEYYGYGVWITKSGQQIVRYHVMGYDPGVSFHSAYYTKLNSKLAICANISDGAYDVMREIETVLIR